MPRAVELVDNRLQCDVVVRIQLLVEVVGAENRFQPNAGISWELAAGFWSGEVELT